MTHVSRLFLTMAALAAVVALPLSAAGPSRWEISSTTSGWRAVATRSRSTREGRVTLGPAMRELHEDAAPALWTVVTAPDGTIYAGTGNDGQVVASTGERPRSLGQRGTADARARLARRRPAGRDVADGKVYRITPRRLGHGLLRSRRHLYVGPRRRSPATGLRRDRRQGRVYRAAEGWRRRRRRSSRVQRPT